MIHSPVRLDTQGICGGFGFARRTRSANGSRTPSIIAEWNAWEVARRREASSFTASLASRAATATSGPETTVVFGAFTAAIASPGSSRGSTTSTPARTASIVPAGTACISAARSATRRSASSRPKTPARQAATYSPRLCPIIEAGRMPHSIHRRARACSTTKSAGCVTEVWPSRRSASPEPPSRG